MSNYHAVRDNKCHQLPSHATSRGSGATFPRIALVFWYRKPVLQNSCSKVAVYCRVLQSVSHVSTHHSCFLYQKPVLQRSCSVIVLRGVLQSVKSRFHASLLSFGAENLCCSVVAVRYRVLQCVLRCVGQISKHCSCLLIPTTSVVVC